ncbi:MAG: Hpt domain-containing protein, partial [Planctomycetota bacterium]
MSDDNSLLNEFVDEAKEHLHTADVDLLHLEKNGFDPEVVDRLFRSVHSIKGVSGFLDLHVIGTLSHAIENIFSGIRSGDIAITPQVLDVLLEATKRLQELIEDIHTSNQADISALVGALERTLADALDPAVAI